MTIVFNKDRNIRKKDYKNFDPKNVLITKVFPSFQGEGPFTGQFAVFVRLAGCNLGNKGSCKFCDTQFAFDRGIESSPDVVLTAAEGLRNKRQKLMVLTGGEPLLQNVEELLLTFLNKGWKVQIETNGYFWWSRMEDLCTDFPNQLYIVVSPKVNARQIYPDFNSNLLDNSCCLKILIEDRNDSPYLNIPQFAHDYAKTGKPVYISPINAYRSEPHPNDEIVSFWHPHTPLDLEQCEKNTRYAAKLAFGYGYRLSLQTHLFAVFE